MADAKRHWETPQILSDLPLRGSDKAHFHFDEFAVTLARLIADPATHTPLTIGVSGAWGSGKTTLLQRVKAALDTTDKAGKPSFANEDEGENSFRKCKTVWFDAWRYSDESELLVALVRVILREMKKDGLRNKVKAIWEDPQQPEYDLFNTVINAFQFKIGAPGAEVQFQLDPQKHEKESPFVSHTAFFDHFDAALDRLLASWVHGSRKDEIQDKQGALVVFVDDLDRCLPEKTMQVLEAVKLFLDKPGCVFVLGAHTDIIQQAVTKYYQDAGVTGDNASDYLEKIIQLRFELPPILENQMGDFVNATGLAAASLEHWETIVAGAEINPRKVKTFLNDLNLAWALLANSEQAQGVDRADFTRWQVLMRAAPDAFKKQVHDIDDLDLRFQFVQRALGWAGGDAQAAEYFKDFEKYARLKRTLKKIDSFSTRLDAKVLDAFIHLVAPPKPPEPAEKLPAQVKEPLEAKPSREQTTDLEEAFVIVGPTTLLEAIARLEKGGAMEGLPARPGSRMFGKIKFVSVPKGKFLMGSREDNKPADQDEKPQHAVEIAQDYLIGQFPITNLQYATFVAHSAHRQKIAVDWEKKADHPVAYVSWDDAQKFCQWLNEEHGVELPKDHVFRLPSEAEWEKAARGEFGFEWPWGNEFDSNKCNSSEGGKGGTTPVGAYSAAGGDSPYGAADMAGNVWEWTQSLLKAYPYSAGDGREDLNGSNFRIVRGGSFSNSQMRARCASRYWDLPLAFDDHIGFRVVVSPI